MKKFIIGFSSSSIGSLIGFISVSTFWIYFIQPMLDSPKPAIIAQKEQMEIVAVYQIPGGFYETCLAHKDGTRSLWPNHKLGEAGEKIFIWQNGSQEWIQDPNK